MCRCLLQDLFVGALPRETNKAEQDQDKPVHERHSYHHGVHRSEQPLRAVAPLLRHGLLFGQHSLDIHLLYDSEQNSQIWTEGAQAAEESETEEGATTEGATTEEAGGRINYCCGGAASEECEQEQKHRRVKEGRRGRV